MSDHEEEGEFWWTDMKMLRKKGDSTIDFHCVQTSLKHVKLLIGNLASTIVHRSSVKDSIFLFSLLSYTFTIRVFLRLDDADHVEKS